MSGFVHSGNDLATALDRTGHALFREWKLLPTLWIEYLDQEPGRLITYNGLKRDTVVGPRFSFDFFQGDEARLLYRACEEQWQKHEADARWAEERPAEFRAHVGQLRVAVHELRSAFAAEVAKSDGIRTDGRKSVDIPASVWRAPLAMTFFHTGYYYWFDADADGEPDYSKPVKTARVDVADAELKKALDWINNKQRRALAAKERAALSEKLLAWLRDEIWTGPRRSRIDVKEDALFKFSELAHAPDLFDDLWNKHAPDAWKQGGRPPAAR